MMKIILLVIALLAGTGTGPQAVLDEVVHDFGKVRVCDGPLSCKFTVSNTGDEPLYIQSVVSSCGCTEVKWTRTGIEPGDSGVIEAVYSNDEGPYPFDKTLVVYTNAGPKPIVLHIRGIVRKK